LRLAVGAATVTRLLDDAARLGSLEAAVAEVVDITVDSFSGVVPVSAGRPA